MNLVTALYNMLKHGVTKIKHKESGVTVDICGYSNVPEEGWELILPEQAEAKEVKLKVIVDKDGEVVGHAGRSVPKGGQEIELTGVVYIPIKPKVVKSVSWEDSFSVDRGMGSFAIDRPKDIAGKTGTLIFTWEE